MKSNPRPPHAVTRSTRPSEIPRARASTEIMARAPDIQIGAKYKNKELRLSHQFAALFSLWLFWLATAIYVVLHEKYMMGGPTYQRYAHPLIVYSIIFVAMPLTLVVLGAKFEWRIGRRAALNSAVQCSLIWFFRLLTMFGAALSLVFGLIAILYAFAPEVRE